MYFSSGPTKKHLYWHDGVDTYSHLLGRSHLSEECRHLINLMVEKLKLLLRIPESYSIILVPGSTTGAIDGALWNLLGPNHIDALVYDTFGKRWSNEIVEQLGIKDCNIIKTDLIPNIDNVDSNHDIIMVLHSTINGSKINNKDIIRKLTNRTGIVICDAACAAFVSDIPWTCMDAIAFSPQKGLGGEAGFGMLVLSDRAIQRIENHTPKWPIPRLLRFTDENGKFKKNLCNGYTINTISMMTIIDCYTAIDNAIESGGLNFMIKTTEQNYLAVKEILEQYDVLQYTIENEYNRTKTPICIYPKTENYSKLDIQLKWQFIKNIALKCNAYDIIGHAEGLPCWRLWSGPTVDQSDLISTVEKICKLVTQA